MAGDLLQTKLFAPQLRPSLVARPRLLVKLNRGLQTGAGLTLISAAAGFGKTTLVREWIAGCKRPFAWLSLDERDGDLARFLAYFVAAVQTVAPEVGRKTPGILDLLPQQAPESVLTILLNEIAANKETFVVVLDDYHALDAQTVDLALSYVLEHQPPQMHLVVVTREDPSLPLSRLRARGQLSEVRAADLRFTSAEAGEFLNRVMGLNLCEEDIAALESRTEGWIAGLQLAAISMQGHQDSTRFIQSFTGSHHFVMDYLIDEVLGQQPQNVQAFLLRTSILDRMCGPLCDAILLDPSTVGQEVLEHLERTNLFIVPLDSERRWYRYHHLFGDLLRQRLGQARDLPEYHLRASAWYEQNGEPAQAFQHALAAGDFEQAARLAEAAWQKMERSFQTTTWLGWVQRLPDAAINARPWLCVQIGWAYSDVGELEPSETYLQNAERALAGRAERETFDSIPGIIALIRAGNAQIAGNLTDTVRYAELCLRLVPENDLLSRSQAAITLGFTQWAIGDVEASLRAMHRWMEDMQELGNELYVIASAFVVADMQVTLGSLGEAEEALRQSIHKARVFGEEAEVVTAHHHLGLAMLAFERGEEAARAQSLQTAARLGERTTLVDWPYRWNLAQARLKEAGGEWDSALSLMDVAERDYIKNPIPILQPMAARKARVYLKQGRLGRAQAWALERGLAVTDEVSYLVEYELLTLARVRLAEGFFTGVDPLLDRLLALAEAQNRAGSVIEILLTRALVLEAQDKRAEALAALERALTLTEPEGYQRIFVDEGEAMRSLLTELRAATDRLAAHSMRRYVDKIVAAFSRPAGAIAESAPKPLASEREEPLTARELEVLLLIAEGHSNAEIGQRLYLALSTVKGHNLRIFGKLQVQNRTEAVARARELGLI